MPVRFSSSFTSIPMSSPPSIFPPFPSFSHNPISTLSISLSKSFYLFFLSQLPQLNISQQAHIKSSLIGASVSVPITDGSLALGTWQGIWFLEFRNGKQRRKVLATVQGVKK